MKLTRRPYPPARGLSKALRVCPLGENIAASERFQERQPVSESEAEDHHLEIGMSRQRGEMGGLFWPPSNCEARRCFLALPIETPEKRVPWRTKIPCYFTKTRNALTIEPKSLSKAPLVVRGASSFGSKEAAKSAEHALTGGHLTFVQASILAADPPRSLRGPSSICCPFS
ncbi:MAG: hypothetical protein ACR2MW_01305, partial [Chthoniobacterales bacterium]